MAKIKAATYARYSSDRQQENSIEYQQKVMREYCAMTGIEIVKEYVDRAYSGTTDRRPGFQKLISDAKSHSEWSLVLVYNLDRFARNSADAAIYKSELRDLGISVVSVTQNFGNSKEGFLVEKFFDVMSEYYSLDLAKKVSDGMKTMSAKAKHCGGIPPLGYDVDNEGYLVINQEEAETVRRIFDMFELDYSYTKMAEILNSEGRRNKRGNRFTKYSFNALLQQEKYTGVYIWNKVKARNSKHRRNSHAYKPSEEQIRIEGGCPQIILPEQFRRVQEKMRGRAFGSAESKNRYHYMLGGLDVMRCAGCGTKMVGLVRTKKDGSKYTTYACPNHRKEGCPTKEIRAEYLERMVAVMLVRALYRRPDVANILSASAVDEAEYERLTAKKRSLDKKIANMVKGIESSCSEVLLQRLALLEEEQQQNKTQMAKLQAAASGIDDKKVRRLCKKLGRFLMESNVPEVKKYLSHVVKEVVVSNDDVKISLAVA